MLKPSQILAAVAASDISESATAIMRLSEILKLHGEQITIAAQQTVQDIDHNDIFIGSEGIRLRGIHIPFEKLRIVTRIPYGEVPTREAIMAGEACVFEYGEGDRVFLTVVNQEEGCKLKMQHAAEAIDVAATNSMNTGSKILLSENASDDCEVVDATEFCVTDDGISLGKDRSVSWKEISAMTTQDTLSIAIGRQRMLTINEC